MLGSGWNGTDRTGARFEPPGSAVSAERRRPTPSVLRDGDTVDLDVEGARPLRHAEKGAGRRVLREKALVDLVESMSVRLRVPRPMPDIRTIEPKPLPARSTSAAVPLAKSAAQHKHSVSLVTRVPQQFRRAGSQFERICDVFITRAQRNLGGAPWNRGTVSYGNKCRGSNQSS